MKHYIITIAITLLMSLHIMAAGKSDEAQASSKINHFTWGADIGSTIDISGNDMSTIDIDAFFGYKNKFIRTVGLGAGIKSAIGAHICARYAKVNSLYFLLNMRRSFHGSAAMFWRA